MNFPAPIVSHLAERAAVERASGMRHEMERFVLGMPFAAQKETATTSPLLRQTDPYLIYYHL